MYGELRAVSNLAAWPSAAAERRAPSRSGGEGTPAVRVDLGATPARAATYAPAAARIGETSAVPLPRDGDGRIDADRLAAEDERRPLREAVDAVAKEGEPALERYATVVDRLLDHYRDDLSLSPSELASLRRRFLDQAEDLLGVPGIAAGAALPEAVAARVRHAIAEARERIEGRRDDVLAAAGDLGRLLGERVVDAIGAPGDERAIGRLGRLLTELDVSASVRSTRRLRDEARDRLRAAARPPAPMATAGAVARGRVFLGALLPE